MPVSYTHLTLIKKLPDVKNILYPEEKARIIEDMGIDYLFNIPFTEEILTMPPARFVKDILVDKFMIREAYCCLLYTSIRKSS